MRITSVMMSDNVAMQLSQMRNRLAKVQTDLAAGKDLHKPSDHPGGAVDALRWRSSEFRLDRYITNLSDANAWLAGTDLALDHMSQVVSRARELATKAASGGSLTPADIALIAIEAEKLMGGAVDIANSDFGGYFIFGGQAGGAMPFELDPAAPDGIRYRGDGQPVQREIAPGLHAQVNITGEELRQTGVFETLHELIADLQAGDAAKISADGIESLITVADRLSALRAVVGARQQQVDMAALRANDLVVNIQANLDAIEGIDLERTLLEFNQQEMAYRTALAIGARILPPSLLDFLR